MTFEIHTSTFEEDAPTDSTIPLDNIPIYNKRDFLYSDFFRNILQKNIPCIIKNVTESWEASHKWITKKNKPNIEYLKKQYGTLPVTIYDCDSKYYNSQQTSSCTFSEYLESDWQNNSKYLKDWHLKNERRHDNFYQIPIYFASDWLNEHLVSRGADDYRFVYMGKAGTWTPFHCDVFGSYSWSANVLGKKRWILFPPGEENRLKERNQLPYDISNVYAKVKHFEVLQSQGDAIFVPSGWHHQVWNVKDTISVNHNWINACNLPNVWAELSCHFANVEKELDDCKASNEYDQQCQLVLKASFGMDFNDFLIFLEYIARKRCEFLETNARECVLFHGLALGRNHARFDLQAIKSVWCSFQKHPVFRMGLLNENLADNLDKLVVDS